MNFGTGSMMEAMIKLNAIGRAAQFPPEAFSAPEQDKAVSELERMFSLPDNRSKL